MRTIVEYEFRQDIERWDYQRFLDALQLIAEVQVGAPARARGRSEDSDFARLMRSPHARSRR